MAIKVIYKTGLQGPPGPSGAGAVVTANWTSSDGPIKTVTHNLNTYNLSFSFFDFNDQDFFEIDEIKCLSTNVVQFTSTEPPEGDGWRIIIRQ